MNPEPIMDALLRAPAVLAVVDGASIAVEQLGQGAPYPALVYRAVSIDPALDRLCGTVNTYRSRLQVNPLAATPAQVWQLHALVRTAVESNTERTVAGRRLVSAKWAGIGPASKDEFTGMWTQPVDYILVHE